MQPWLSAACFLPRGNKLPRDKGKSLCSSADSLFITASQRSGYILGLTMESSNPPLIGAGKSLDKWEAGSLLRQALGSWR